MKRFPEWLEKAVFYQIYPPSFHDSNGDGIGDIPGIVGKLDYLESLGVNAVWVNPCFVSPFLDGGYDVSDYYKVAPRYGTNSDLKRLFREAHRKGIRVCLDLVPGHTSIQHPWFKASCRHTRNKYSDRYIWTPSAWNRGDGSIRFINGYAERNGNYAINFFYCQPALNYGFAEPAPEYEWQQPVDAPGPVAMRKELKNIMDFWLKRGADGFRVDMAASLVKNDPGCKQTIAIWREVRHWMQDRYPEAVLISEWAHPAKAMSAGFHADFMLHFGIAGYRSLFLDEDCFFQSDGGGDICGFLRPYLDQLSKTRRRGFIALPSSNHDCRRPHSEGRSPRQMKVFFSFLLMWPGIPFIYYGDEIGMRYLKGLASVEGGYERTGSRTPMQWDSSRNAGFSRASSQKLYLPIDSRKHRPTVEEQERRPSSLLNHVRRLLVLRELSPALQASGKIIPLYAKAGKYPFVFLRQRADEKFLVAVNPSAEPTTVRVDTAVIRNTMLEIGEGVTITPKGKQTAIAMAGVSHGIFRCGKGTGMLRP